jgi:hypothetical protein
MPHNEPTDARFHIGRRGRQRTNTASATEAVKQYAAERAVDDPVKLERAIRIVRLALERHRLTTADLLPADSAQ